MGLDALARMAKEAGYDALCMRASQVGVQSSDEEVAEAAEGLERHGLAVSMVTGDFDIVYNNDDGPRALRHITPYLKLARQLKAPLLRVALKSPDDIPWAQRAADKAAELGLKLAHQCHSLSLFETVDGIEETLTKIDRPNFGLVYEPANLELCGQEYGHETIKRLAPWIMNVYFQNQIVRTGGALTLETRCRGPISFDIIEIHQSGGIDFAAVIAGLRAIRYTGPLTVHQCAPKGLSPEESAAATAAYLRGLTSS